MSLQTVGVLALCATLVGLAMFVLLHNRHAAENRRFALAALTIAGWIFCISFALASDRLTTIIPLGRLGFAFASAIPFCLLWMFDAFSSDTDQRLRLKILLPATCCVAFVLLSLSPWIVADGVIQPDRASFVYGSAHKLFGGAGAITTNLAIPLLWNTSRYSALGPYFSLLVVSFSAHAIIRHRLMDIRVVIRQGVVYVSAIFASVTVFLAIAKIYQLASGFDTSNIPLAEALILATLVAVVFQPLKARIQRSFNRYVYREKYDFQRTIREASRQLSSTLDLQSLLQYLSVTIEDTFKAECVTVYLRAPREQAYIAQQRPASLHWDKVDLVPSIAAHSAVVSFMEKEKRPLVQEEALRKPDDRLAAAAVELQHLRGAVAFPLFDEYSLAGMLIVGPKRSGDPYFNEDIDLLSTLVGQAAVAMKNAHLYREVVLVNEYVDNILSTMASGVIAVDGSGHVSLFNRAAEQLTGITFNRRSRPPYSELPASLAEPLRATLLDGKAYSRRH